MVLCCARGVYEFGRRKPPNGFAGQSDFSCLRVAGELPLLEALRRGLIRIRGRLICVRGSGFRSGRSLVRGRIPVTVVRLGMRLRRALRLDFARALNLPQGLTQLVQLTFVFCALAIG